MSQHNLDVVAYRLTRAEDALVEAQNMLEIGHITHAVNREYYACFYAAYALLYLDGYTSAKHGGVIALFDQHWMKPKLLPADLGKLYHSLFDRRQLSDYGDRVTFERSAVEQWLAEATEFVKAVSEKAREKMGD